MLTAKEIAQRLAAQAESVAAYLLPNGKRVGRDWVAGDVHGGDGKSLKVCIAGEKAGIWCDFSNPSDAGDLIDLWALTHNVGIGEAIKDAKEYLGIHEPDFAGSKPREYRRPDKPLVVKAGGRVLDYLCGRGLTMRTIEAFHVRSNEADDEIVFPFIRDKTLINVKYLKLDRPGGKKLVRQEKDAEPCLFGWHTIPATAREVVICEGECDCMTWWQKGFPALSVWSGAGNVQWIENEWDRLARFDTIYVSFDMDDAGKKGLEQTITRLGRERCRVVELPYKDANECLQRGLKTADFAALIAHSRTMDPKELHAYALLRATVDVDLDGGMDVRAKWGTPFERLNDLGAGFNEGELVILNGINGHGKTSFASELMLSIMKQGGRVCIASMEVRSHKLLARMVQQAGRARASTMTMEFRNAVHDWLEGKVWMFNKVGSVDWSYLLEVFRYARRRYDIRVFLIDSLAKCGIDEDDYSGQKRFVEALCDFKNDTESTVFLVTHSRKLESEFRVVDKMDIKGSGAIGDLADTITILWRNKRKEDKPDDEAVRAEPDAYWYWRKNRNGDFERPVSLWFDIETRRYSEAAGRTARPYVPFSVIRSPPAGAGSGAAGDDP